MVQSSDLVQKRISIVVNKDGSYNIVASTIPQQYKIGSTIPAEQLSNLIREGVTPIFVGDLASEAPGVQNNMLFG